MQEAEEISITFTLEAEPFAGRWARHAIAVFGHHVSMLDYERLRTVITELVMSAVQHGAARQPIEVRVTLDGNVLRGEVEDRGGGVSAIRSAESDGGDALGARLVDLFTDEWGMKHGTHVWFRSSVVRSERT